MTRTGNSRFTIGELAKRARVRPDTILYYERRGLLPKAPRSLSGYRVFSSDSVRLVRFIKQAQRLGFSLREIEEILALRLEPNATCGDMRDRVMAKVADIDAKVRRLKSTGRMLSRLAAACEERRPLIDCPILERLESESAT